MQYHRYGIRKSDGANYVVEAVIKLSDAFLLPLVHSQFNFLYLSMSMSANNRDMTSTELE